MDFEKNQSSYLNELRKRNFNFKNLPDEVDLGIYSDDQHQNTVPLSSATVDHLALSMQVLNGQLTELLNTFDSIRNLHDLARSFGAKGGDYAVEYIREHEGDK